MLKVGDIVRIGNNYGIIYAVQISIRLNFPIYWVVHSDTNKEITFYSYVEKNITFVGKVIDATAVSTFLLDGVKNKYEELVKLDVNEYL